MTASWPIESLGDICKFKYGKSLKSDDRVPGVVEVMGSNGRVGWHDQSITAGPTVVVGRKGSIGQIAYSRNTCWPIDTTYYIDSSTTKQDLRWLYWTLQSVGLTGMNKSAAVPGLNREDAYRVRIPLPPLPEQRRIADILDRADDLRAQRRRALMFLGELAESALTRISDTSSKVVALGDVSTIDAKLVDPREDSYASYPLVAPDNIESNTGRIQNVRTTAEVAPISGKYLFTESDVLYSKIRPALNKVALPDFAGLCSADMYPISIDAGEINREFLWATLRSAVFLAYAQRLGNRAQMPKLNRAQLFGYEFKLPTLESQRAYASELQMVQKLDHRERAHLGKLDELFASLQHRAFQGEL